MRLHRKSAIKWTPHHHHHGRSERLVDPLVSEGSALAGHELVLSASRQFAGSSWRSPEWRVHGGVDLMIRRKVKQSAGGSLSHDRLLRIVYKPNQSGW